MEDGKTIKELFPFIVKDIYFQEDRERSLCPSFMKSGSISLSLSQNEISLKNVRAYSIENKGEIKKEEVKKEEEAKEEEIKVEEVIEQSEPVHQEEEPKAKDNDSIFSKERRNRKFTRDEDDKLKSLVKVYGEGAWSRIAEEMEGRNRKQVRERYVNFLKKERITTEFTPEEDAIILQFVQSHGRKWSTIAEQLTGKTPIMIKNRYYAKLRRTTKEGKQKSEPLFMSSRADSSTGGQLTPSHQQLKHNGIARETAIQGESLEKLKSQEESMRLALAELRKKIERVKANGITA